jgi:hypothetical protein
VKKISGDSALQETTTRLLLEIYKLHPKLIQSKVPIQAKEVKIVTINQKVEAEITLIIPK